METTQMKAFCLLKEAVDAIREAKPDNRSEIDRRYAIVITMLEKAVAFFDYYIN